MKRSALLAAQGRASAWPCSPTSSRSPTDLDALEERVRRRTCCCSWRPSASTWHARARDLALAAAARALRARRAAARSCRPPTWSRPSSTTSCPSNIGGDVVRVRDSSKLTGSTAASLAVVGIDRILGFGALYALAARRLPAGRPGRARPGRRARRARSASALAVRWSSPTSSSGPGTARALMAASRLDRIAWAHEQFEVGAGRRPRLPAELCARCWARFAASLALQALVVCYYYCVARALRIPLPAAGRFLMVPLCTLVQAVPISFNGWGMREGSSPSTSPRWACRATAPSPSASSARA